MSYISKKRSKNYLAPAVFLTAGITATAVQTAAADTVQNGSVASSGNTVTGWDTTGKPSAGFSDANSTASSATSGMSSAASDKASSNTSGAPAVSGSSAIGWIDVYVDHSKLDEAINNATAKGVDIVHDPTVVKMGDASATAKNTSEAASYYASQASYINSVANQYTIDMSNYNAEVARNRANADQANAEMNALRNNIASQGQVNVLVTKQYSPEALAADKAAIAQSLADGKAFNDAKAAMANAQTHQNSLTLFTTGAAQGHIKIQRQTVKIATPADAQRYIDSLNSQYTELQTYLNGLQDQNGSIPDEDKPTYTLYDFVIDETVEAKGTAPVTTFNYTPVPVTKPVTPSVNYHIYDIRSQPTSDSGYDNLDGEKIIVGPNDNAGGNVVAQAMVNQTVGISTDNQPLPSERFDKIQDLTIVTKLPEDVEFDMAASNTDPTNWTITYDEATRTVTQTATPQYLVQVNLNQNTNNSGTVGGTTNGEWKYKAPQVFFKLLKDDHTYQATSTTIVNKEYMFVGQGVQIRTDSADPSKVNTNSQYQNIDGKAVLPGSINNYILGWDFNQYKNVNIDSKMQEKGLHLVDDYPEEAVEVTGPISIVDPSNGKVLYSSDVPTGSKLGSTGTFKDANGKEIEGFTWTIINNDTAPDNLKGKLNGEAIMISYVGKDNAFYKTYVEGGKSLNVVIPMTTKKIDNTPDKQGGSYNGNEYQNVAYQSDFGNDYKSNTVTNTAPKLDPRKDAVLSFSNLESLDINSNATAAIENGTYFQYRISGSKLPKNLSEDIKSYVFSDELDTEADEYNGEFIVQNNSVIKFKAGSALAQRYPNGIPAGSDISKYFTQTIKRNVSGTSGNTATGTTNGADTKVTRVDISADADFLAQIDYDNTNIHFDAFMSVKRIKNKQEVKNVFNETINGVDYGSNEVRTNSKPNALDALQDQLNSLQSSASSGIASNASDVASMAGALSVIVNSIDSVRDSSSSAISSVASDAASNSSAISSVASNTSSAINSLAVSASGAIALNSSAIASVASSTASQASSIASSANSVIASLAARLSALTEQSISTLTIYDTTVKSDADALQYAVNRGIAPGSIKSIAKNADGRYVVKYNKSSTAINGSKPSVSSPTTSTTKKTNTFTFYTLKSADEVYTKLASMGYPKSSVVSITLTNGAYKTVVYAKD